MKLVDDAELLRAVADFCAQFARVALQLDDAHLSQAFALVRALAPHCRGCALFVLGDSAHSPCCADEVAALHAGAQAIVHVGPTCLSTPSSLPILIVTAEPSPPPLGESAVDLSALPPDVSRVLCDPQSHRLCAHLIATRLPQLEPPPAPPAVLLPGGALRPPPLASSEEETVLFVGRPGPRVDEIALTRRVFLFDADALALREYTAATSRSLARRLFLVEKAKAARIVGIVVGTLSTAGFAAAADRLRALVLQAGLKPYVLLMGKLSAAKLGNFPHVDAFALVACPLAQTTASRDFPRPLLTAFELEVALSQRPFLPRAPGAFDFAALLDEPLPPPPDEPVYSLYDGALHSRARGQKQLALAYSSPAADALALGSFRGLDADAPVEAAAARPGRGGVAAKLVGIEGGEVR